MRKSERVSESDRKWEEEEIKRGGDGDKVGEMEWETRRVMEGGRVREEIERHGGKGCRDG